MERITLPGTGLDPLFHINRNRGQEYRAGALTIVPVTGRFEGPALRGEILPGGADWNTSEYGATRLDSKYLLRTDDGAMISMHMKGWEIDGAIKAHLFFTAAKKYKWLCGIVALARSSEDGGIDALMVR